MAEEPGRPLSPTDALLDAVPQLITGLASPAEDEQIESVRVRSRRDLWMMARMRELRARGPFGWA